MKLMSGKQIRRFATDEVLRKRLAKLIVQQRFRNTKIENIHADGKLSQEDMKAIMVDAVNTTYTNLSVLLCSCDLTDRLIELLEKQDMVAYWDEPVFQLINTSPGFGYAPGRTRRPLAGENLCVQIAHWQGCDAA